MWFITRLGTVGMVIMALMLGNGVALADGATGVAAQPLTPKPGEVINVSGDLLGPNSTVEVRLSGLGADIDLGEVVADAEGDFTAQFRLPDSVTPGTYQLRATGDESATTEITVLGGGSAESAAMAAEPELRQRPLSETVPLIALFGVLAGLGIFFARFTRKPHESAAA